MAALSSPATQASYAQKTPSSIGSISRLCLTRVHFRCRRLRAHTPISSACFLKSRLTSNGLEFDSLCTPFRKLRFSPSASLEDSTSVSVKGSEAENPNEALDKSSSHLSDIANHAQENFKEKVSEATGEDAGSAKDAGLKAEAGQREDSSDSSNKFIGVLRDTTEELKEHAEKARAAFAVTAQETAAALAATAQETAERSKENLSYFAENAPDPIREIADAALKAHSADTPKKFAKIHDFCLGIPYGTSLVIGGLLWFILSGSTAAIRFGVILGGILLGLSVSSLNAWKQGKSTSAYIQGQAAISSILAFRETRRLFEVKASFPTVLIALISAGMLGFYVYVLLAGGNPPKKTKLAPTT